MGLNLKDSIDQRRIHHQLYPENGEYEIEFPKVIFFNLKKNKSKI
jgi:hypothetical protein